MHTKLRSTLKLRHSICGALFYVAALCSPPLLASSLSDHHALQVYGVQTDALMTLDEAIEYLDRVDRENASTESDIATALHRFLVYDALRVYLGYLLHINPKPDSNYFAAFAALGDLFKGDFTALHRDAVITALELSKQIRFDVSIVQLTSKELYNKDQPEGIESQIETLVKRLRRISRKLETAYPASRGELPPVLLAYASSVFTPKTESERTACAKKFSEKIQGDVFRILATRELDGLGQLLQSPVVYNITPMGSVSSKAKN